MLVMGLVMYATICTVSYLAVSASGPWLVLVSIQLLGESIDM